MFVLLCAFIVCPWSPAYLLTISIYHYLKRCHCLYRQKIRPSKYNMGWPKPGESWETSSKLSFTMAKVAQLLWNKKTFMTAPVVIQSISLSLLNITGSHPYVSSWKHRTLERGTLGWIQRNRLLTGLFWKLESEFPLIIIVNAYLIVTSHTLNSHEIKSSDYFY